MKKCVMTKIIKPTNRTEWIAIVFVLSILIVGFYAYVDHLIFEGPAEPALYLGLVVDVVILIGLLLYTGKKLYRLHCTKK